MKISSVSSAHWALSDQGQGHSITLKFFSIYHNTNCQVLYLSFGTWWEVLIKYRICVHLILICNFLNNITLE